MPMPVCPKVLACLPLLVAALFCVTPAPALAGEAPGLIHSVEIACLPDQGRAMAAMREGLNNLPRELSGQLRLMDLDGIWCLRLGEAADEAALRPALAAVQGTYPQAALVLGQIGRGRVAARVANRPSGAVGPTEPSQQSPKVASVATPAQALVQTPSQTTAQPPVQGQTQPPAQAVPQISAQAPVQMSAPAPAQASVQTLAPALGQPQSPAPAQTLTQVSPSPAVRPAAQALPAEGRPLPPVVLASQTAVAVPTIRPAALETRPNTPAAAVAAVPSGHKPAQGHDAAAQTPVPAKDAGAAGQPANTPWPVWAQLAAALAVVVPALAGYWLGRRRQGRTPVILPHLRDNGPLAL